MVVVEVVESSSSDSNMQSGNRTMVLGWSQTSSISISVTWEPVTDVLVGHYPHQIRNSGVVPSHGLVGC